MESRRDKDIKQRKDLNADTLFSLIRSRFENLKDHRSEKAQIPLADAFMSAFAMFSLKDPSFRLYQNLFEFYNWVISHFSFYFCFISTKRVQFSQINIAYLPFLL